jgi:glyoxylase-like metal-dependent hydrolase (beta-lactamase superfamily II)
MISIPAPDSVVTVDCHYGAPDRAAAYLLVEGNQAAFVENNTSHAVPLLLEALEKCGLQREDVAHLIITHVHLDHAGGTGALVEACPNATVVAHPRAERHLVDPQRLIDSATRVYGAERFEALYGSIRPIPADRIRVVADEEPIAFGGRTLTFLHTPGHAKHHICIHDSATNGVFTGDAFGLALPDLQAGDRPFVMCTTAPTDYDPAEARRSVQRILDTGAEHVYLTHFGELSPLEPAADVLLESLGDAERVYNEAFDSDLAGEALGAWCREQVQADTERLLASCGVDPGEATMKHVEEDVAINAAGIAFAVERGRKKK